MTRRSRGHLQLKTPRTRSKFKLALDPAENDKQLTETLRELGLYAAHTLGDGACLFRALSDQHYGSPDFHCDIRQRVCDYIEAHPEQYKAFVDDPLLEPDEAFAKHIAIMRQPTTYGSHLEISACARMLGRPIKVIQPGMIYVVRDEDESPTALKARGEEGKARRFAQATSPDPSSEEEEDPAIVDDKSPLYIIYHSWEHYSSARNLTGPHSGKPRIQLKRQPTQQSSDPAPDDADASEPTQDEQLLLRSLPDPTAYSLPTIRALIASKGGWELALEHLLDEASRDPSPTPSTSRISPSPIPPSTDSSISRPYSPKRALSASMRAAALETPNQRRRMTPVGDDSSLSELSSDDQDDRPKRAGSSATDEEVSQFEDEVQPAPTAPRHPERMQLRSSTRARTVDHVRTRPMSGREKKEANRRKKHEQRLLKLGRYARAQPEVPGQTSDSLAIKELRI